MRLRHLILTAALAGLAACQDSPITQADPSQGANDLSKVTILTPAEYEAHGIPALAKTTGPSMLIQNPCYPDYEEYPCGGGDPPDPPQYAYFDYYTHVYDESNAYYKQARLHSKSDSHANVSSTALTISYRSVGGCSGTPSQFDSDYFSGSGTPVYLVGERYATYAWSMTFKWGVNAWHSFTASPGYYITGYSTSYTFPTSHQDCI